MYKKVEEEGKLGGKKPISQNINIAQGQQTLACCPNACFGKDRWSTATLVH